MASADFCGGIVAPLGVTSPKAAPQISQGKTRNFPPTYPPHLRRMIPDDIGLRVSWPSRPSFVASYAVRVPRTGSLPAASFRFWVAPATLAVRLGVPVIKASIGTCTRQVTSWVAFDYQLKASVKTLRVMPDAPKRKDLRSMIVSPLSVTSRADRNRTCTSCETRT